MASVPLVEFDDAGADLDRTAPQTVVVTRDVDQAARLEVGVEGERLPAQAGDRGVEQLVEVVGQDFRGQADGDAFHALGQQQRKLDRQRDRFLVAAVVGEHPFGRLGIEDHLHGELAQPCLDVTRGGSAVSREDVAPVTLRVDQQLLLSQLHEGVADGGVARGGGTAWSGR